MKSAREIELEAQAEIDLEDYKAEVALAKERIRARMGRTMWQRLFPFRIKIERR